MQNICSAQSKLLQVLCQKHEAFVGLRWLLTFLHHLQDCITVLAPPGASSLLCYGTRVTCSSGHPTR